RVAMTRPQPVSSRIGVTRSDRTISTSPIIPVVRMTKFTLLTPRCPCQASQARSAAGTRALRATNCRRNAVSTKGPPGARPRGTGPVITASVVGIEVEAGVEARHLVGVTVEHQGLAAPGLADPLLGRLAPARVIVLRVHVAVEAVLVGRD